MFLVLQEWKISTCFVFSIQFIKGLWFQLNLVFHNILFIASRPYMKLLYACIHVLSDRVQIVFCILYWLVYISSLCSILYRVCYIFICLECLKLKLIHHACVIFFPFSQTLLISNICLTFSIILCQRALFIICIQHVALYSDYCFHSDSLLKFKTTWILVDNYFIVRHIFYFLELLVGSIGIL